QKTSQSSLQPYHHCRNHHQYQQQQEQEREQKQDDDLQQHQHRRHQHHHSGNEIRVYTGREFSKDEMILEYTGEVISRAVAIRRERSYRDRGVRCTMMWCDFEDVVIDSSVVGNRARYIRGALPNVNPKDIPTAYAKVAIIDSVPKVIICASKHLKTEEEL